MAHQVIALKCPNCGDSVDISQRNCKFCKQPIIISTLNSLYEMPTSLVNKYAGLYKQALVNDPNNLVINHSIATCFLNLKLYDRALEAFEKAMIGNDDNSETFYYAAVCLLNGKKAFLAQRNTINKIEEYINAANMIEPKGIHYYFLAYIKFDFYYRKYFSTSPTHLEAYATAQQLGLSHFEIEQLYSILGVQRPDCI